VEVLDALKGETKALILFLWMLTFFYVRWNFDPNEEEIDQVKTIFDNDYKIPSNFSLTAEPFKPRPNYNRNAQQAQPQLNPQTTQFCEKLGIDDPLEKLIGKPIILTAPVVNPDEIALEDDDEEEETADHTEEVAGEDNGIFFVDTKPLKRSKMSLPHTAEKEAPLGGNLDENDSSAKVADQDVPTTVKKFKRRNQELYMDPESST
jgi:lariat debranching enzyme